MNYLKAARGSLPRTGKKNAIQSAAETELGRRLTAEELSNFSKSLSLEEAFTNVEKYGFGSIKFLLLLSKKPELKCSFSPNVTPRDGNCLLHAISDGILYNDAFKHTGNDDKQQIWANLLKDFKFYDNMDDVEHINYLRTRFVSGASEWLAGKCGSKENDKIKLGYSDDEWDFVWSTMLEDGAWAVPSVKDAEGNTIKENNAPEMFINYAAHELKCHILVFDLQFDTVRFCSGNYLKYNNVVFDSPLILYSTGSHFQSVFQLDHDFFIGYALQLEIENSPPSISHVSSLCDVPLVEVCVLPESIKRKPAVSKTSFSKKQKKAESDGGVLSDECLRQNDHELRLDELKKIKPKERTDFQTKELENLRKRKLRQNRNIEKVNIDNKKNKLRMENSRER